MNKNERLFPKSISEQQELEKYYNKDITNIIDELDRWANCKQFVHSKCYIIGNGLSRKGLDLEKITRLNKNHIRKKSFVIGCNYIYKICTRYHYSTRHKSNFKNGTRRC